MTNPITPLQVLYEDNHIIVVLKQRNVPSQADNTGDVDMLSLVKEYIKISANKPGNVYLALVHRLDRPTGGVMVFAKTSKSASRLSEQLQNNKIEKKYIAIVVGNIKQQYARLEHHLVKDTKNNIVKAHTAMVENSKKAILEYKVLEVKTEQGIEEADHFDKSDRFALGVELKSISLTIIDIHLITGRSHQIRAQMSAIGYPLYADHKYQNPQKATQTNRKMDDKANSTPGFHNKTAIIGYGKPLALWAYHLKFTHPVTGEILSFRATPPETEEYWKLFAVEKYIAISKPT
ncbi:MAG: RluA family pseudouridine synthase [Firmicutes bacterium]|nr:RluA family pseudouridine synthase [Bacillota bacterium]